MSELLSGQISFTGLGSGTDFQTMIDKLIEVESTHKKQLELWKQSWELKNEALGELNNSIVSLRTTLQGLDTMNKFLSKEATSSNTTVLTATADSTAEATTHYIEVDALARNSIWVSGSGVAKKTSSVTASNATFTYSYQKPGKSSPTTVNLDINAGDSLETLVGRINTDPDNPGIRATIISDGDTYYLQLRGLDLGSEADLVISNASFGNLGSFSETQGNQDARLKVNGWPSAADEWIRSSSNTVDGAIDGLNLSLKETGTTQITVNTDTERIVENVHTIVDKINEVRTLFFAATNFDEVKEQGSIMTGNYAVQLVESNLKRAVAGKAQGFEYYDSTTQTGDLITSLAQLGIKTDADEGSATRGMLVVDEDLLRDALSIDAQSVAEFFSAQNIGDQSVKSGSFRYYSSVEGITKPGVYDVSYTISGGAITSATIGGYTAKIDNDTGQVTAQEGPAKGIVFLVLDKSVDGNFGGDVRLKQGKTRELSNLLKEYSSSQTGPMRIVEDNYEDIIKNIDKKIDYEETRLTKKAATLRLKFARLEALLGQYDQLSTSLGNQIKQLDNNS
jgi:flagellar hook-associated protein 2